MPETAPPITARISAADLPPTGFTVVLDPQVRSLDHGRHLIGGSPLTAMRLSPSAREHLVNRQLIVTDSASARIADRLLATNLAHPVTDPAAAVPIDDITVVVPVRDRPEQLSRCLAALAPLDVIVVDDASLDPSAVATVARQHGASLVVLETNLGPAGARNAGLERVTTRTVAFVDSDVEATAASLLHLTRHLTDPLVSLVGPRVVGHIRTTRPRWFERYDAAASSLSLGPKPYSVRPGAGVGWLPSACLVGRTEHLGAGFDTAMRVGEDVDLVWRLVKRGHRVRYEPAVTVRHDVRRTVRGWLGRKVLYGSGGALLAKRHGSQVAPAVLSPTMAVAGAAILLRGRSTPLIVAAAIAYSGVSVAKALPHEIPRQTRGTVAGLLAIRGAGWAVRQESALLLRHWWPVTALGICHPWVRRALATALVVDTAVAISEHLDDDLDILTLAGGRRLDDLAYGAGLWWGALSAKSPTALRPRRPIAP